jgi:predicted phosphodiesterase
MSDIHFGQEHVGLGFEYADVRAEILSDCQTMVREGVIAGPANGILLTGDVAQAGKESQFREASVWLDTVCQAIGCDRKSINIIPGNHDVDLDRLGVGGASLQEQLRSLEIGEADKRIAKIATEQYNPLMDKLSDYRSFAEAYGSDFKSASEPYYIDIYKMKSGRPLRVIGLCSVTLSDRNDKVGNMFLGMSQCTISRNLECEDIYLVHHPLDWFKDQHRARNSIHSRARVLITGHEHYPNVEVIYRDGGHQQIVVASGAVNPPEAGGDFKYTYNWLEFDWQHDAGRLVLAVTVYPRVWSTRTTRFMPDFERTDGAQCRLLKLDCGPVPFDRNAPAAASQVVQVPALEPQEAEVVVMPITPPLPPTVLDGEAYEELRFLFWRHLDRATRQRVLVDLGVLHAGAGALPSAFERSAFERASQERKLAALWDATMPLIPYDQRRPNPFSAKDH